MGISDRKEREREELRERILRAAVDVFMERGYENTSIRAIADRIEYSPTTIYLYYKDKGALLHAVHRWGFQLMFNNFQELQQIADPFERLTSMGRLYLRFAFEHRGLYDLMFIQKLDIAAEEDDCWHEGDAAFNLLIANVKDCISSGQMRAEDPELMAFTIWTSVHGMATAEIKGRCDKLLSPAHYENLPELTFSLFVRLLQSFRP